MEITSPKLTRANELNTPVSAKIGAEAPATVSTLEEASDNNRAAAIDISRLTSDQKTVEVANQNKAAARIDEKDITAFTAKLSEDIVKFPEIALAAPGEKLTAKIVGDLLS